MTPATSFVRRATTAIGHVALAVVCRATAIAQITVGPNAQISADMRYAAHTEYFANADPADSRRMVACSMMIDPSRSRLSTGLYLSVDGGERWRLAAHDTTSRYGASWDPSCAFGPGGIIYFATIPTPTNPVEPRPPTMNRFVRSTDGGKTWDAPVFTSFLDNEDLVIDWTDGPTRGRVYAVGTRSDTSKPPRANHMALFYSADSGRTYQGPVERFAEPGTDHGIVGAPVVLRDGRLLVPLVVNRERPRTPPGQRAPVADSAAAKALDSIPANAVAVMSVTDGGKRIDAPVRVASYVPCRSSNGGPLELAVDRSSGPFHNRIYATFVDASHGRCAVMLSWSDDGAKWSKPIGVDDPRVPTDSGHGPDAFFPLVRVNDRGVVGITWYDRREDPENHAFRQRFTASLDGGETFMRSVAVSTAANTFVRGEERETYFGLSGRAMPSGVPGTTWLGVATGPAYRTYDQVGDYGGMAVRADGVFQPVWVDNRSGVPQLYTAPVRVAGAARRNADRDAVLGRNVTDSVTLLATSTVFDRTSCSIQFGLDVINRSHRALELPLVLRANQLLSQFGEPQPTGASDDMGRPLWSIGGTGSLAPGAAVSYSTRVPLERCANLGGIARFSLRSDPRMDGTPVARLAGPKMLAIEASVFEPVRR